MLIPFTFPENAISCDVPLMMDEHAVNRESAPYRKVFLIVISISFQKKTAL